MSKPEPQSEKRAPVRTAAETHLGYPKLFVANAAIVKRTGRRSGAAVTIRKAVIGISVSGRKAIGKPQRFLKAPLCRAKSRHTSRWRCSWMKTADKAKNPIAIRSDAISSGGEPRDNAADVTTNAIKQPRSAMTLARFGMWSTVSDRWSRFSAQEQQLISSFLGLFIGAFVCCAYCAAENFQRFAATHKVIFLLQAKLLAVFPLWYVLGFISLFFLVVLFTALFERGRISHRPAVLTLGFFLCFAGISFWCSQLSSLLQKLDGAENLPLMFNFAPLAVCAFALFWGWCAKTTAGGGGSGGHPGQGLSSCCRSGRGI